MPRPTFREASDLLCLSGRELAELFEMPAQSVKQARMSPAARGFRRPPEGWEPVLARLAKTKARALNRLAKELEG